MNHAHPIVTVTAKIVKLSMQLFSRQIVDAASPPFEYIISPGGCQGFFSTPPRSACGRFAGRGALPAAWQAFATGATVPFRPTSPHQTATCSPSLCLPISVCGYYSETLSLSTTFRGRPLFFGASSAAGGSPAGMEFASSRMRVFSRVCRILNRSAFRVSAIV